jgi:L-seryl-tRNA(Ser) seleniumtransferase
MTDDVEAIRAARLRALPAVHELAAAAGDGAPRWAVVEAARRLIALRRAAILRSGAEPGADADAIAPLEVARLAASLAGPRLRRVVNATGVVVHTNLGRAPLAPAALAAIVEVARGHANLEYDLARGERGHRHVHVEELARALTGAEAACVVNNNAAATVLALAALAAGREVIVSRGELVEIGGSFRVPDILRLSGGTLVEVGTTNRTRLADYERAIGPATATLLKVHRANFALVGFTEEVGAGELAALARARGLSSMFDLGSGALLSRAEQRALGLPEEPPVAEAIAAGVDVVCCSGDKLLGGPQAGLIVGKAAAIAAIARHPLMRAVRPDKLTLAALAATLALYRDGRAAEVPVVARLATDDATLRARAVALAARLRAIAPAGVVVDVATCASAVGGGALPLAALPSHAVTLAGGLGAAALEVALRHAATPVIARIADDRVWLDVRTIADDEHDVVAAAVAALAR